MLTIAPGYASGRGRLSFLAVLTAKSSRGRKIHPPKPTFPTRAVAGREASSGNNARDPGHLALTGAKHVTCVKPRRAKPGETRLPLEEFLAAKKTATGSKQLLPAAG